MVSKCAMTLRTPLPNSRVDIYVFQRALTESGESEPDNYKGLDEDDASKAANDDDVNTTTVVLDKNPTNRGGSGRQKPVSKNDIYAPMPQLKNGRLPPQPDVDDEDNYG